MALYLSAWSMKYAWDFRCSAWVSPLTRAWCYWLLLVLAALWVLGCCFVARWRIGFVFPFFCSIPIHSFFCAAVLQNGKKASQWRTFCSECHWVLYLSHIRSHLSPPSVLLCSQSICSWIQGCLALRAEYLGHGTFVGSAKGNLLVQGERQKKLLIHMYSVFQTEQEHALVLLHVCPLPVLAHSSHIFQFSHIWERSPVWVARR